MAKRKKVTPGIKIQYFQESQYPIVEGLRCVQVLVPDDDAYLPALAGMISVLSKGFNYARSDYAYAQQVAQLWRDAFLATNWEGCDEMNCEELIECLTPLFDALMAQNATILENIAMGRKVPPPTPVELIGCDDGHNYAGSKYLVDFINTTIVDLFEQVEAAAADNVNEVIDLIISAIPVFETLPIDELLELSQWMFDNEVATYVAAYDAEFIEVAACDLWCRIKRNGCSLSHEVLNAWLVGLEALLPGNAAATVFSRYGDAIAVGILQQIDEFIANLRGEDQTIATYFNRLMFEYENGSTDTDAGWELCGDCDVYNITLIANQAGAFNFTFVANTITGGSIWQADSVAISGFNVISCNIQSGGIDVCCLVQQADPVTNYQHFLCDGGAIASGSGDGSGATPYQELGWYTATPGTTVTIEVEPAP